jgi:hypothetical protein
MQTPNTNALDQLQSHPNATSNKQIWVETYLESLVHFVILWRSWWSDLEVNGHQYEVKFMELGRPSLLWGVGLGIYASPISVIVVRSRIYHPMCIGIWKWMLQCYGCILFLAWYENNHKHIISWASCHVEHINLCVMCAFLPNLCLLCLWSCVPCATVCL